MRQGTTLPMLHHEMSVTLPNITVGLFVLDGLLQVPIAHQIIFLICGFLVGDWRLGTTQLLSLGTALPFVNFDEATPAISWRLEIEVILQLTISE